MLNRKWYAVTLDPMGMHSSLVEHSAQRLPIILDLSSDPVDQHLLKLYQYQHAVASYPMAMSMQHVV